MNAALQACDEPWYSMYLLDLVGTVEDDPYYPCQGAPLLFNSTLWFQHAVSSSGDVISFCSSLWPGETWKWYCAPFVAKFHCIMTVIGFNGHFTDNHGDSKLFGVPLSCSFDSWRLGHVLRSQLKDQIYLVRIHGALHTHMLMFICINLGWGTFDILP